MVVVEHARQNLGNDLRVLVTSVLTTANGRMVFARPAGTPMAPAPHAPAAPAGTAPGPTARAVPTPATVARAAAAARTSAS
jgi:hypothetical protein